MKQIQKCMFLKKENCKIEKENYSKDQPSRRCNRVAFFTDKKVKGA